MCFELCNNIKKNSRVFMFQSITLKQFFSWFKLLGEQLMRSFKGKRELCDLSLRNACATGDNI